MRALQRLHADLDELATATGARARLLAWRIRELLATRPLAAGTALGEAARAAISAYGLEPVPVSVALAPGQTWLLAVPDDVGIGTCGWLTARRSPEAGLHAVGLTADGPEYARRAVQGLAAALHSHALGAPDPRDGMEVEAELPSTDASGSSLGLAVAVAVLSHALGEPPDASVAGSAEVLSDGRLRPVRGLGGKLAALERARPGVRTLVVAERQEGVPAAGPVRVVECATLWDALTHFRLVPTRDRMPLHDARQLALRIEAFLRVDLHVAHTHEQWRHLGEEAAWCASEMLAAGSLDAGLSVRAKVVAALCMLHAGCPAEAYRLLRAVSAEDRDAVARLDPWAAVMLRMVEVDHLIDVDPAKAADRVPGLLAELWQVTWEHFRVLCGRVTGTAGRAYLHAGQHDKALVALDAAARFHAAHEPGEAPRSRGYHATCLRMRGDVEAALTSVDDILRALPAIADRAAADATRPYQLLEKGRCHLALGQPEAALEAFAAVDPDAPDAQHPRIGALRGMAAALRRLGRTAESDAVLDRCLAVAAQTGSHPLIPPIAALAAGDALLDLERGLPVGRSAEGLWAAWRRHEQLAGAGTLDAVRAVLRHAVY